MEPLADVASEPVLSDIDGIFTESFGFVWANLRRLGVAPGDLDDAAQEVFVVVHRRRSALDSVPVRAWLYGIVRRIASRYRRGDMRRDRLSSAVAHVPANAPDLEDDAIARESIAMVDDFLARLDADKREVFVLAEIEQMSGKEIAAALGIPADTVWSRLRAAREAFERHFVRVRAEVQRASGVHAVPIAQRQALALSRRSPPASTRRRVAAALAVRLASPEVLAKPAWWATPLLSEVWIVAATVAVGSAALVGVRAAIADPPVTEPIAARTPTVEPRAVAPVAVIEGLPPAPVPPPPIAAPSVAPAPTIAIPRAPAREPTPVAPATDTSTLAAELTWLERARKATDPSTALALAETHARVYPSGMLAADGLAIRIAALCQLGRDADATALARALARIEPDAPWTAGCTKKSPTKAAAAGDGGS